MVPSRMSVDEVQYKLLRDPCNCFLHRRIHLSLEMEKNIVISFLSQSSRVFYPRPDSNIVAVDTLHVPGNERDDSTHWETRIRRAIEQDFRAAATHQLTCGSNCQSLMKAFARGLN